ncbi:hypothetical protein J2S43_007417 [Catenuloplanes nepalensis]|uniref:PPM-type phosphatase domain-containing protein n=1 Tax=Catenuloplanes nepalensis TaxID=587533 RepID=A0ABT9N5C0_9ACTN|nr:hypothetical protein [Catenuloplanes nepalensis]MDP9798905.1 hypothetical protein [Catenuloplanes nepalensis]
MRIQVASQPSTVSSENEDWVSASPALIVVLDGATARTGTGCRHGISWYAAQLGAALSAAADDRDVPLIHALELSIERVAGMHPECDLTHEATPSAAVGLVRFGDPVEYLVLGDVSVVIDVAERIDVISDERVSQTAISERLVADQFPIGAPEKSAAMVKIQNRDLKAQLSHPFEACRSC